MIRSKYDRTHVSDDKFVLRDEQRAKVSTTTRARRLVNFLAFPVLVMLDHNDLTVCLFQACEDQRPIKRVCFDPRRMVSDIDSRQKPEREHAIRRIWVKLESVDRIGVRSNQDLVGNHDGGGQDELGTNCRFFYPVITLTD